MPWLLAIGFLLTYEAWALATGRRTLSGMARDGAQRWPLLPFVAGGVSVGLGVHFWWPWCPP